METLEKLINRFWQPHVPMQWKIALPMTVSETMWETPLPIDFIKPVTQDIWILWSPLTPGDHMRMVWNTLKVSPLMKKVTTVLHTVANWHTSTFRKKKCNPQRRGYTWKFDFKNWSDYNKFLTNTFCQQHRFSPWWKPSTSLINNRGILIRYFITM